MRMFCMKAKAQRYIIGKSKLTLSKTYQLFLADPAMKQVFRVFLDDTAYPILVHCSLGKDRTGVVCAMLQLLLRVEEERVLMEFSESGEHLKSIKKSIINELSKRGLDESFYLSNRSYM